MKKRTLSSSMANVARMQQLLQIFIYKDIRIENKQNYVKMASSQENSNENSYWSRQRSNSSSGSRRKFTYQSKGFSKTLSNKPKISRTDFDFYHISLIQEPKPVRLSRKISEKLNLDENFFDKILFIDAARFSKLNNYFEVAGTERQINPAALGEIGSRSGSGVQCYEISFSRYTWFYTEHHRTLTRHCISLKQLKLTIQFIRMLGRWVIVAHSSFSTLVSEAFASQCLRYLLVNSSLLLMVAYYLISR
ncbi:hypothetical protein TcasGA2_TC002291 [Tribolium castaneum]|uniref:Uncharacterized protein n=1 Tax=Tribolium castaneum TaxID=7070 RepID=D7EHP4_TRICA|nr:hypothetical protein TcasGA2_TC002291 [Tribolium castaneum]